MVVPTRMTVSEYFRELECAALVFRRRPRETAVVSHTYGVFSRLLAELRINGGTAVESYVKMIWRVEVKCLCQILPSIRWRTVHHMNQKTLACESAFVTTRYFPTLENRYLRGPKNHEVTLSKIAARSAPRETPSSDHMLRRHERRGLKGVLVVLLGGESSSEWVFVPRLQTRLSKFGSASARGGGNWGRESKSKSENHLQERRDQGDKNVGEVRN